MFLLVQFVHAVDFSFHSREYILILQTLTGKLSGHMLIFLDWRTINGYEIVH
jgi:hypothetical protein